MSLREEIEKRRLAKTTATETTDVKAENAASEPAKSAGTFLRLIKADGQCFLIPWSCFHGASFTPDATNGSGDEKCEQLHLVFMSHEVVLHGLNLGSIVDAIEETNLRLLCEVAEKYEPATNRQNIPVIIRIEVSKR